ncbi:hypothetical protein Ahy_A10g050395 isoform E [Arachis hypogaea]|uniref:Uncharacterized protein n=1 Tax=Arachis hypogaea TaxID=3818 RepID=A0A445B9A9_ARAHY|nr:hypothetical protein Ahy_A10g050395 isoform E [Arachis hypogaea]
MDDSSTRGGGLLPRRSAIEREDPSIWNQELAPPKPSNEELSAKGASSVDSMPEGDGCLDDTNDKSDQFPEEGENVKELA